MNNILYYELLNLLLSLNLLMEEINMVEKKEYNEVETFYLKLNIPLESDTFDEFDEFEYYDFYDSKDDDEHIGWKPLEV